MAKMYGASIGVQPLQDIEEVNMFKDDNTVVHFKRPLSKIPLILDNQRPIVQFSVRENLLVVTGNPETKELKDMMPEILKQVGPQQYSFLKDIIKNVIPEGKAGEEDEDDVPELVGNFEDASKK
jgi:nascent polypeptide-associated complex subunit beta